MLMELAAAFPIPDGFVITPDELLDEREILVWFSRLQASHVAVRSSALNEDSSDAAWAGQLDTFLHVTKDELLEKIARCRASAASPRALAYAASRNTESGEVAVIVHRMLDSRVSGVAFSHHPVTAEAQVVIEAVRGYGDMLVSGEVTPDTYIGNKIQNLAADEPVLQPNELKQVIELTLEVEKRLGHPVDVEWAFEGDTLYLLQARPITTV